MFCEINAWIDAEKKLDLMMVIGTTAQVYPAARFAESQGEGRQDCSDQYGCGTLGGQCVEEARLGV